MIRFTLFTGALNRLSALVICGALVACAQEKPAAVQENNQLTRKKVVQLPEVKDRELEQLVGPPQVLLLAGMPKQQRAVTKVERNLRQVNQDPSRSKAKVSDISNAISDNLIGVFGAENSGIKADIWQGSTGPDAIRSLLEMPRIIQSPTLHNLAHRLLATQVSGPQGTASHERFFRTRMLRIFELGHPATLVSLARSVPRTSRPPWLEELAIRGLVAIGQDGEACRNASLIKKTPSTSAWLNKLRLACVLIKDGPEVANERFVKMLKTGQIADDQFATVLKAALAKDPARQVVSSFVPHVDLEPELLLLDFVDVTAKGRWYSRVEPSNLIRLIRAEGLRPAKRAEIAEFAARQSIISGDDLAKVYQEAIDAADDQLGVFAKPRASAGAAADFGVSGGNGGGLNTLLPNSSGRSSGLRGTGIRDFVAEKSTFAEPVLRRAQYLERAKSSADNGVRVANVLQFMRESIAAGLLQPASIASIQVIRKIPVVSENLGAADVIIVAALMAGETELAEQWLQLILRDPVGAQLMSPSAAVPLSYLQLISIIRDGDENIFAYSGESDKPAAGDDEDGSAATFTITIPKQRGLGLPPERMITSLLDALQADLRLPIPMSDATERPDTAQEETVNSRSGKKVAAARTRTRSTSLRRSTARSELPLSERMRSAAIEGRGGESIAFLTALQGHHLSRPEIAARMIETLRRLGLEEDARALALEILTARRKFL